jgi:hypothetical protein
MKAWHKQVTYKIERTPHKAKTKKSNKLSLYARYQKLGLLSKAGILMVKSFHPFVKNLFCFTNANTSASAHN